MTFSQLADNLGVSIYDLISDWEMADYLADIELYDCGFVNDLVREGILVREAIPYGDYQMGEQA